VELSWERATLDQAKAQNGFSHYLFAFFTDTIGNVYAAPYPGVKRRRTGPSWRRRTVWTPESGP
jgi:hypothetical protein